MSYAVRAEGLVKRFGATTALDGVDLEIPAGQIVGMLGPNGAGKTTAVRVLATLLRPDAGHATVGGYDVVADPVRVRSLIGLTGQYASVDEDLTGFENLVLIGRLLNHPGARAKSRATELLAQFSLTDAGSRAVKTYSGGMRRRIDLAASLVGRPEVLYLDEPTTGLDPHARTEMWQVVRNLVAEGTTVLLTTQYLDEADHLADRITVIDSGRVVADGRPDELKRRIGGQTVQVRPSDPAHSAAVARILADISGVEPLRDKESGVLSVPAKDSRLLAELIRRLDAEDITADELALRLPTLDDVFIGLTGHAATSTVDTDLEGTAA